MKFRRIIHVLVITFLLVKCSESNGDSPAAARVQNTKAVIRSKPASSFDDSLLIDRACAVFYQPDSLQLQKIKSVTSASVFEGTMHDYFYQKKYARTYLEKRWPQLKLFTCSNVRFLVFEKKDASSACLDLNTLGDSYGVILFDGMQNPQQIDMTNIDTQVPAYFKRH